MSDFEFNAAAELTKIRGATPPPRSRPPRAPQTTPKPTKSGNNASTTKRPAPPVVETEHAPANPASTPRTVEAGLEVKQSHQETPSGGSTPDDAPFVDYKAFKPLRGIFDRVPNDLERPVRLNPAIKKVSISGQLEPMFSHIQHKLAEKHIGVAIHFPWGDYEIDARNRVLTTNASLMRYLTFDAMRDGDASHVQYAKQMFALTHPGGFDKHFNVESIRGGDDSLDVFVMLLADYLSEDAPATVPTQAPPVESEQVALIERNVERVLEHLTAQAERQEAAAKRADLTETVLLLDRLGLLKGGLPKDVGQFVRTLEVNRDALVEMQETMASFIGAEDERERTLARERQLAKYRKQKP